MQNKNKTVLTSDERDFYSEYVKKYCAEYERSHMCKPKVYVQTFGCQQNESDSEHIVGIAESLGYEYTEDSSSAELIVFNTCAVREHAELKALSLTGQLKHLKEKNKSLVICICGCMVSQEHRLNDIKNKYPYVDLLFGATTHRRFAEYLGKVLMKRAEPRGKKRLFFFEEDKVIREDIPVRRNSSFKAWVSIMSGCNNFCTYCVVPYVRGRERSRDKDAIIKEVKELASKGYREITLLGQNVNSYASPSDVDYRFPELLRDICKTDGDFWIRFMTSHPKDTTKELIDIMAEGSKVKSRPHIAEHFHLPLQSGSDSILKAMNRRYDREKYLSSVSYMREKIPNIALTTDIIVGFPGESEADFDDTLDMLEKVRYDAIYSFIYSPRRGTPAAEMKQLDDEVKKKRFARMLELQNAISLEKNKEYIGKTEKVLVEGISKTNPDMMTGRNERNRLIHFPVCNLPIGEFAHVEVVEADAFFIKGIVRS